MGETSKTLGGTTPFEFDGKTYRLGQLTYADQAEFENVLERRAVAALGRAKAALGEDEYRVRFNDLIGDIAMGRYSFGGPASAEFARSVPGLKELFYLSLHKNHAEVTREFVDAVFDAKAAEAAATMGAANSDPFAKGPAATENPPPTP